MSAAQGSVSVAYLYVGVYTCIVLACFQLGSRGRPKRKSDHTPVSHLKAYFFSTSLTKTVCLFFLFLFFLDISFTQLGGRKNGYGMEF